jgi:hypothetical protein
MSATGRQVVFGRDPMTCVEAGVGGSRACGAGLPFEASIMRAPVSRSRRLCPSRGMSLSNRRPSACRRPGLLGELLMRSRVAHTHRWACPGGSGRRPSRASL